MATRRRFAVPAILAGLIGIGVAVPAATAGSTPDLPAVTASQLVADVLSPQVPALSGTVQSAPQLGLPAIGPLTSGGGQGISSAGAFDPVTLLTSDETFRLWIDGSRQRIAAVSNLAETDNLHVGHRVWVWDSATQHVTDYEYAGEPAVPTPEADPQALAAQVVGGLEGAGTIVSVAEPVDVAGRPAYVLRLAPADAATSTVSFVDVAVDAVTHVVLQVSVEAAGQIAPALEVGFTSVRFAAPSAGAFTPPHGTTTTTRRIGPSAADFGWFRPAPAVAPSYYPMTGASGTSSGTTGTVLFGVSGATGVPPGKPSSQGWIGYAPLTGASVVSGAGPSAAGPEPAPVATGCTVSESLSATGAASRIETVCPNPSRTMGKGWSTVLLLPSSSVEPELRRAATPVSGSWGSGALVTSSLLNVLVQPGRVLVGFVPVAALEADAASAGS